MAKVAIVKCNSYDFDEVHSAINKGISLIGGIEKFVDKNEQILLKPNLAAPVKTEKAALTHPVVIDAFAQFLQDNNYKNIKYGDSPGTGTPDIAARVSGIASVMKKRDIPLADFKTGKKIEYNEGQTCKTFDIAQAVLDTDCLITLPKLKAHGLTRITAAVKNQYGCIYGFYKQEGHANYSDIRSFSKMIVDLNNFVKPRLCIADGIVAMEGNGPLSGTPKKLNVLLFSDDPVALDAVFCKIVDMNPEYVPTILHGTEYGLGNHKDIELVGDDISEFFTPDFKMDRMDVVDETYRYTKIIRNVLLRRPVIQHDKCKKCGVCVELCPPDEKALHQDSKDKYPYFDYKKCIRCYCCQELCPHHAIEVKTPLLGKLLVYK